MALEECYIHIIWCQPWFGVFGWKQFGGQRFEPSRGRVEYSLVEYMGRQDSQHRKCSKFVYRHARRIPPVQHLGWGMMKRTPGKVANETTHKHSLPLKRSSMQLFRNLLPTIHKIKIELLAAQIWPKGRGIGSETPCLLVSWYISGQKGIVWFIPVNIHAPCKNES